MEGNLAGMRLAEGRKRLHTRALRDLHQLAADAALADPRGTGDTDQTAPAMDRFVEDPGNRFHFTIAPNQCRLTAPDHGPVGRHRLQTPGGHRLRCALDGYQRWMVEHGGILDEPSGGFAKHDTAWWCDRFHPLRHPDLRADGRVTRGAGTDLADDHVTRIQPDPKRKRHTVSALNFIGEPRCLPLYLERCDAGTDSVIFQRDGRTE